MSIKTISKLSLIAVLALSVSACALSKRDTATLGGAALGGVAGSVLTGGSTIGTVGGAAVGGLIGNQVTKKSRR